MQPITSDSRAQPAPIDWFDRLTTSGALFAVDLDQRVTHWSLGAARLLGPAEQAMGRRCYEVTSTLDPRNAGRCGPGCAVMMAAKHHRAHPDFEVYLPPCARTDRARVSVMLVDGESADETVVLHILQPVANATRGDAPGEMRAKLQQAAARVDAARQQWPSDDQAVLTDRQHDVLVRLAAGASPREIAQSLGVREVTVRNHIQGAMDRLGAHSRLEAVLIATNQGLL